MERRERRNKKVGQLYLDLFKDGLELPTQDLQLISQGLELTDDLAEVLKYLLDEHLLTDPDTIREYLNIISDAINIK